jgi:non-homologous end joining protein Ku
MEIVDMDAHKYNLIRERALARIRAKQEIQEQAEPEHIPQFKNITDLMTWLKQSDHTN